MDDEGDMRRSSSPRKRRASSMANAVRPTVENVAQEEGEEAGDVMMQDSTQEVPSIDEQQTAAAETVPTRPNTPTPPMGEQIVMIESLLKLFGQEPLAPDTAIYCVSKSWLGNAMKLGDTKTPPKDMDEALKQLGPVDNSDILDEVIYLTNGKPYARLKAGVDLSDFEAFPADAWGLLIKWHGLKEGQIPIERRSVGMANGHVAYECHPLFLTVHLAWAANSPFEVDTSIKTPPIQIAVSRRDVYQPLLVHIKKLLNIPLDRRVRVWSVKPRSKSRLSETAAFTPPESRSVSQESDSEDPWNDLLVAAPTVLELDSRTGERTKLPSVDQTVANLSLPAAVSTVDKFLDGDSVLVIDCETGTDSYVLTHTTRSEEAAAASKIISNRSGQKLQHLQQNQHQPQQIASAPTSGRSSPSSSGPMTRGRAQQKNKKRPGRGKGVVGFQNLGNTCYMNSALQCMRSVEELTKYFLTDEYKKEINQDNPLGYGGSVAHSYGKLIREIYESNNRPSLAPKGFRNTVGNFRSQFASWSQQDSQEFLGFMLDALQEDLSRVKKKPYIEKPDSTDDMIDNPEAVRAMADKVWDITRLRDDSVIADLFTGMYKSTLKCPDCGKISITFDPFNNLTLPLPVENMQTATIRFFPLNDVPVELDIEVPKHSTIDLLKQFIAERTGVPAERMIGAEEYQERFFKIYADADDVTEDIRTNDQATFHELEAAPTNWPAKTGKFKNRNAAKRRNNAVRSMLDVDKPLPKGEEEQEQDHDDDDEQDPRTERMVVPVIHRIRGRATKESHRANAVAPPHFVVLTRDEANDEDAIRRKVLEKVATFSTWPVLHGRDDESGSGSTTLVESEMVSDGESNGAKAKSVEGEEDMVDVSVKEVKDSKILLLKRFNTRRPAFMDPETFLDPKLQDLFTLHYFSDDATSARVPTGWTSLSSLSDRPLLSTRVPQSPGSEPSLSPDGGSSRSSTSPSIDSIESHSTRGDDSDGEGGLLDGQGLATRMTNESSDEDASPPVSYMNRRERRRGKAKPPRTYGKKDKHNNRFGREKSKKFNKAKDRPRTPPHHHQVPPQPLPRSSFPLGPVNDMSPGPLIRLGEGIIVEWDENAWTLAFDGTGKMVDLRGTKTWSTTKKLRDVALIEKQRARMSRRRNGITLDECLDEFEKAEVLSAQDMWYCPRCKDHRRASKKFDLWKTPDILVCHLKRFSANRRDKLDVPVDFPVEGLDLTQRVVNPEEGKEEVYDLIAVDDHFGGLGGGHYTAYARNFVDGRWYDYNDSSTSPKTILSGASSSAYLLFYRRRSSAPLGGPRFAEIARLYDCDDDDDNDDESGEDQRLGGASSRLGSSSAGKGVVAHLPRASRGLASGDADDDLYPVGGGVQLVDSDEGVALSSEPGLPPYRQSWDWSNNYAASAAGAGSDYPSDQAQGSDVGYAPSPAAAAGSIGDLCDASDDDMAGSNLLSDARFIPTDARHVTDADFDDVVGVLVSPADPEVAEIHIGANGAGPRADS